jgi:polysaccharide biosynthesis protein PslH
MRTLVIAGDYPWPTDTGARLRLAMILRGLVRCGPTELFSIVSKFRTDFGASEDTAGLANVGRIGFDNRIPSGRPLLPTLLRASMPLGMQWRDRPEVSQSLRRFVSGHYDLVWFFGARPWVLSGEPSLAPTVIDLIDLEDQKILAWLSMPRPSGSGAVARIRQAGGGLISREEARRWQRLHRRAGSHAAATVVCSSLDAQRATTSGVAAVAVIPNGFSAPAVPVGRDGVGSPPHVLFQGLLTYPPNAEAARWLAQDIGPALRTRVPNVRIRLVGEHHPDLDALSDPPSVTLTGRVADMSAELARADVVVVPLRYGSGTRLKILEAFAHRIPVVSTALGAEGLGVEGGVQLLLAETADELAEACSGLLHDPGLRQTIVANGRAHFLEHFESTVIEAAIGRLAHDVATGQRPRSVA